MKEESKDIESFAKSLTALLGTAIVSAIAILFVYFLNFGSGLSGDHVRWAEFGNFAGGTIGPLVSFFAFFALLATLALQNKTLRISKEELELTRKELEKTSEAAQNQSRHFTSEARITDIIESIRELEHEIARRGDQALLGYNTTKGGMEELRLSLFLNKESYYLSRFTVGDADEANNPIAKNRQDEIGEIFRLLFEQIISLQEIPAAKNRYRIFMKKHLETFYYLAQVGTLRFDWVAPLDAESKNGVKRFEKEKGINQEILATAEKAFSP